MLQTIVLLLCYKIKYPNNFFLLRGNHEVANLNRIYGFYDECECSFSPLRSGKKLQGLSAPFVHAKKEEETAVL